MRKLSLLSAFLLAPATALAGGEHAGEKERGVERTRVEEMERSQQEVEPLRGTDAGEVEKVFGSETQWLRLDSLDNEQVRSLQNKLQQLGYYTGNVSGQLDENTRGAVNTFLTEKFIASHRHAQDGKITHDTAALLGIQSPEIEQVRGVEQKAMRGQHSMQGKVTQIDKQRGTVTISTAAGIPLQVHFPSSALTDVKVGDQLQVQLGFEKVKQQQSPSMPQ